MQLVVVYGLKTSDYDWLSQFYPSRRISLECANRSIPLRFLFPDNVPQFIAEIENAKEIICLIRGAVLVGTVRLLENAGIRCVNSASAMALVNDKLATARFLERHRWPTPETVSERDFRPDLMPFHWPLVRKPRFGSRGMGVSLVSSPEELARLHSAPQPTIDVAAGEYILQQYIKSSHGRDLRFFFAGGEIIAVAERKSGGDNLLSNASAGAVMRIPETPLSDRWSSMALAIARESGLWYGSVDFLYLNEEGNELDLTVCEINSSPGFEALETDCGYDIAGTLIDRLLLGQKSLLPEK